MPARRLVMLVVLALLAAACGGSTASPAPSARPDGVTLLPGAAVSAMVGSAGGELTAADPAGGRSYRLSVPAGAVGDDTKITMAPIAAIDGHPFDGGLLGGVELGPDGTTFLAPVTLVITLDADRRAALKSALDAGEVVAGFSYPGTSTKVADDLGLTLADVAADAGSVTLTLFHFTGAGSGKGKPGNLNGRPCPVADRQAYAECEIRKILHPPGAPADPGDPAIRGQIATVLRDWQAELVLEIAASSDLPEEFRSLLAEAVGWHGIAQYYGLLSGDLWAGPTDVLWFEGSDVGKALDEAYTKGLSDANRACAASPAEFEAVLEWIELHEDADQLDIPLPPYAGLYALHPINFCLSVDLVPAFSPAELAEGDSGQFTFDISTTPGLTDAQLAILKPSIDATPVDPARLSATGSQSGLTAAADVTAIKAVPGRDDEGEFDVVLRLLGLPRDYAKRTTTFDITSTSSAPPAVICSGAPVTVATGSDSAWALIRYDGGSACAVVPNLTDDDDPNAALALDLDPGDTGWDGHDGPNWSREGAGADSRPGTYEVRVQHDASGRWFIVSLTVDISSSGSGGTMTVRDVSIRPES